MRTGVTLSFSFDNIIHRLDPMAVTDEVVDSPLEIAAFKVNTKAFDLLAPRYKEGDSKKQISQLLIWALTEEAPSAAFMSLFESVPLAEVNFELLTN